MRKVSEYNRWLEEFPLVSGSGIALQFRSISRRKQKALKLPYQELIYTRGEVLTREDNWHDYFNALTWLAFPELKASLNFRHFVSAFVQPRGGHRSEEQDALTIFDEGGVLIFENDQRTEIEIFGHAVLEEIFLGRDEVICAGFVLRMTDTDSRVTRRQLLASRLRAQSVLCTNDGLISCKIKRTSNHSYQLVRS